MPGERAAEACREGPTRPEEPARNQVLARTLILMLTPLPGTRGRCEEEFLPCAIIAFTMR